MTSEVWPAELHWLIDIATPIKFPLRRVTVMEPGKFTKSFGQSIAGLTAQAEVSVSQLEQLKSMRGRAFLCTTENQISLVSIAPTNLSPRNLTAHNSRFDGQTVTVELVVEPC